MNGKVYIGFAADPKKRWSQHKKEAEHGHGYAFHNAIRKYGWNAFDFEVICCGSDRGIMLEYVEPALIEQYQSLTIQNGYNVYRKTPGFNPPSYVNPNRKTLDKFIQDALAVHGKQYDYSKSIYKTDNEKVSIICKKHGEFNQKASHHLQGHGCQRCGWITTAANLVPGTGSDFTRKTMQTIYPRSPTSTWRKI